MLANDLVKSLGVDTDPWGFSRDSIGTIIGIITSLNEDKIRVLSIGANNAAASVDRMSELYEIEVDIIEEHPAISAYYSQKYKDRNIELVGLELEGEYGEKKQEIFRIDELKEKLKGKKYNVVMIEGPRASGSGRAMVLDLGILEDEAWIFWANAKHELVAEAVFKFEAGYGKNTVTSFHSDTRDGLAITRVSSCPII